MNWVDLKKIGQQLENKSFGNTGLEPQIKNQYIYMNLFCSTYTCGKTKQQHFQQCDVSGETLKEGKDLIFFVCL